MGRCILSTPSLLAADLMTGHPDLDSEDIRACLHFASERVSPLALIPAPQPPAAVLHKLQAQPALVT